MALGLGSGWGGVTPSGTFTFPSGSTGALTDMGTTQWYRYANAENVYAKGKADGSGGIEIISKSVTVSAFGTSTIQFFNGRSFIGVVMIACVPTSLSYQDISPATSTTPKEFTNGGNRYQSLTFNSCPYLDITFSNRTSSTVETTAYVYIMP